MSTLNFRILYCALVVAGLACTSLFALHQIIGNDQLQMLHRGYLVSQLGQWTPYGNASDGGLGNTPGYLSTFFVGDPLILWDSLLSPMVLLIVMMLGGYLLLDNVIKQVYSDPWIRLFFGVLYWLNPWMVAETQYWNPSYLFFFSALHLWTAFGMSRDRSFWLTALHVLSVGAAAQMHFSSILLFFISLYLFYRNIIKVQWWGVAAATLIWVLSVVPYIAAALDNPEIAYNTAIAEEQDAYIGRSAVHVYPALKAIAYWFRMGSTLFSKQLLELSNFDWIGLSGWLRPAVEFAWRALLFAMAVVTIGITLLANKLLWDKIKPRWRRAAGLLQSPAELLMLYTFSGFFALLIIGILSPITFAWWHTLILFHCAILPIVFLVTDRFGQYPGKIKSVFGILAAFFVIVNLVSAYGSGRHGIDHVLTEYRYQLP